VIKFKRGVELGRMGYDEDDHSWYEGMVTKECISAMSVVSEYFDLYLDRNAVITSVCDGTHMEGSKHYEGNAFDVRTWVTDTCGVQIGMATKMAMAKYLQGILGMDYDVIAENTHIHVEYDPDETEED